MSKNGSAGSASLQWVGGRAIDFGIALLCGVIVYYGTALGCEFDETAYPSMRLKPNELWPMYRFLFSNMAWLSAICAVVLVILSELARLRHYLALSVMGTLLNTLLLFPLLMGAGQFMKSYRWYLLAAIIVISPLVFQCGRWLLYRTERRVLIMFLALSVLLSRIFHIGLDYAVELSRLYPFATIFLAVWAQGTAYVAVGLSDTLWQWRKRKVASAAVLVLAGVVLGSALLDPWGVFDRASSAHLRSLASYHCNGIDCFIAIERSAKQELYKVRDSLRPLPRIHRLVDIAKLGPESKPSRSHHVVFFIIDALRRDHVGVYGDPKAVTPNLDRLALESTLYERAFSPSAGTGRSMVSFLSGIPSETLYHVERIPLLLPQLLRHYGYETRTNCSIEACQLGTYPAIRGTDVQTLGFDKLHGGVPVNLARKVVTELKDAEHPRFEYVHLFYTHGPFVGPGGDLAYRRAIAYSDRLLGAFVITMKEFGLWDNTILVVFGDHGEAMGDHGVYGHNQNLFQEQIAVALVVHVPGEAPRRISNPISLDVLPRIVMEGLGARWPVPPSNASMPPHGLNQEYAMQEHHMGAQLVWRSINKPPWVFHHRYLDETEELYNLRSDPLELTDVSKSQTGKLDELRKIEAHIAAWEQRLTKEINNWTGGD